MLAKIPLELSDSRVPHCEAAVNEAVMPRVLMLMVLLHNPHMFRFHPHWGKVRTVPPAVPTVSHVSLASGPSCVQPVPGLMKESSASELAGIALLPQALA